MKFDLEQEEFTVLLMDQMKIKMQLLSFRIYHWPIVYTLQLNVFVVAQYLVMKPVKLENLIDLIIIN